MGDSLPSGSLLRRTPSTTTPRPECRHRILFPKAYSLRRVPDGVLGGSGDLVSKVISPLIGVIGNYSIVTLSITLVTKSHDPLSSLFPTSSFPSPPAATAPAIASRAFRLDAWLVGATLRLPSRGSIGFGASRGYFKAPFKGSTYAGFLDL